MITLVKGMLSTAAQLAQLARGVKSPDAAANAASSNAATSLPSSAPASDAMRQVVAGYDMTNVSPRAFSEMLQKLRQAGTLSDKDYQELSSIRADLDRDGANPDQGINLVDRYTKKFATAGAQPSAAQTATQPAAGASVQRQLDWLQKFARLRAGQGFAGIDALA